MAAWLNRDGHDRYRYITLGFGNKISRLAVLTDASSVDGEWNSGRMLPELTQHGAGALTSSKYFGKAGLDALSAMLHHADRYGLEMGVRPRPVLRAAFGLCRLAQGGRSRRQDDHRVEQGRRATSNSHQRSADSTALARPDVGHSSHLAAAFSRSCLCSSQRNDGINGAWFRLPRPTRISL